VPTYEVGDTLAWGIVVKDPAGTMVDPTMVAATVTLPDGTSSAATVTKTSTGTYTAALVSTQAGRHRVRWTATGVNASDFPHTDHADVLDLSRLIIPLADARAALNLPASAVTNDDEIRGYIAAATAVIEDLVGPVLGATRTEVRSGGGRPGIALFDLPAAVSQVVESGVTLTTGDWCMDEAGVLWRGSEPGAATWARGAGNVTVTYTVGGGVIAPNVLLAAREQVRFLYQQGQQSMRPQIGDAGEGYPSTPSGYAVPNRVIELLTPSMAGRTPGIA